MSLRERLSAPLKSERISVDMDMGESRRGPSEGARGSYTALTLKKRVTRIEEKEES